MWLSLVLLPLCVSSSSVCVPSSTNKCGLSLVDDETSLLQVHQQVNVISARQDGDATTTPMIYGTSKFGAAGKASKIKLNGAGDILLFVAACKVDVGAFFFFCFVFTFLYRSCPGVMAARSVVGFNEEKEREPTQEWLQTPWKQEDIDAMPKWGDGLNADGSEAYVEAKDVFKKKNNWPAPKSARFCEDDLVYNKKEGWLAWCNASWGLDLWSDDVANSIGQDHAFLLIFTEMAMEIMGKIGGCMVLFMAPVFIFLGGGAAKKDVLSWQGVGNVWYDGNAETLHEKNLIDDIQYIWFIIAFATWFVVIGTQNILQEYQTKFIQRRKHWLRASPPPQSRTLIVEMLPLPPPPLPKKTKKEMVQQSAGVAGAAGAKGGSCFPCVGGATPARSVDPALLQPEECIRPAHVDVDDPIPESGRYFWDDAYLTAFFDKLFPGQIDSAYVVRKASPLMNLVDSYCEIACGLTPEQKHEKKDELMDLRDDIEDAQEDMMEAKTKRPNDYYSVNGFVTFNDAQQRDGALFLCISDDSSFYDLSAPPLPQDIIFEDLETDTEDRSINNAFGMMLIVALFFTFMPIVLMISQIASLQNLESVHSIKVFLKSNKLEATVGGVLASLGLTIMMSMLPTFLMWIFILFCNKSEGWKQLELQKWYYWFLVIFVLLVTCVGSDLEATLEAIAHRPFTIFSLLANRMPLTTHFYLNYVIMQPLTHGMNLTRYINLMKYWLFKKVGYGNPGGGRSEAARFKSEPEDQDYYGMGSRSARFTFMLLMGLVFGTICPLMNVVVFFNFWACRLVYGYLIPCAESRKNDLGGEFWLVKINQLSQGMIIYIVLQVGIISHRCESSIPGTIAFLSFFQWAAGYAKLRSRRVYQLALADVKIPDEEDVIMRESLRSKYTQNLEEVYMVPFDNGKGEAVWLRNFESM